MLTEDYGKILPSLKVDENLRKVFGLHRKLTEVDKISSGHREC